MSFFLFSVLLIGGVSFLAGFLGPISLNPEANQGPLLGIFITGPLGAIAGGILGLILPFFSKGRVKTQIVVGFAILAAVGILLNCFPEPKYLGTVYRGTITKEEAAANQVAVAIADWESRAKQHPRYQPRAHWQEEMRAKIQAAAGRIVTLEPTEAWRVYQARKPWNQGQLEWKPTPLGEPFQGYVVGGKELPSRGEYLATSGRLGAEWPPPDSAMFLGVVELALAPPEMRPP